jgi:hypothetical protein
MSEDRPMTCPDIPTATLYQRLAALIKRGPYEYKRRVAQFENEGGIYPSEQQLTSITNKPTLDSLRLVFAEKVAPEREEKRDLADHWYKPRSNHEVEYIFNLAHSSEAANDLKKIQRDHLEQELWYRGMMEPSNRYSEYYKDYIVMPLILSVIPRVFGYIENELKYKQPRFRFGLSLRIWNDIQLQDMGL